MAMTSAGRHTTIGMIHGRGRIMVPGHLMSGVMRHRYLLLRGPAAHHRHCCESLDGRGKQQQPDDDGFKQDFHDDRILAQALSLPETGNISQ